jgi:hypothetical protein
VLLATIELGIQIRSVMSQGVETTLSSVLGLGFGAIDPSALLLVPGASRSVIISLPAKIHD